MIERKIKVDCIVSDPAYVVAGGGNKGVNSPRGILSKNDGKIFDFNDIKMEDWIPPLYDILADPGHIYLMSNFLNLRKMMDITENSGFKLHNLLIWEKNNATPNRWYMKNVEYTVFGRKGKAFSINNKGSMTCTKYNNIHGERMHPTQKPINLFEEYILNSTQEGDTVFDPFMGSCTAGIVCKKWNRKFIGVDIDKKYFDVSLERVSEYENATIDW